MKRSNIDHLNSKIINLINRLNTENDEREDYFTAKDGKCNKGRLKTDYGNYGGDRNTM